MLVAGPARGETYRRFGSSHHSPSVPSGVKVLISWSGDPSRSIAGALNDWLEGVLPQVEPWISDEEIRSGRPMG